MAAGTKHDQMGPGDDRIHDFLSADGTTLLLNAFDVVSEWLKRVDIVEVDGQVAVFNTHPRVVEARRSSCRPPSSRCCRRTYEWLKQQREQPTRQPSERVPDAPTSG